MRVDIPIDPDADTARQWIVEELSKDAYNGGGESWLDRFFNWLSRLLSNLRLPSGDAGIESVPGTVIAIALGVVLVGVLIYLVVGPLRRSRRGKDSHSVFDDDDRPAAMIRDAAKIAAAAGDWTAAVLERFRAMVRTVEESGWVAVVPGMTAYEFVSEAALRAPDLAAELAWAGDTFDGIRYGHELASPAHYARMSALDESVQSAKTVAVHA